MTGAQGGSAREWRSQYAPQVAAGRIECATRMVFQRVEHPTLLRSICKAHTVRHCLVKRCLKRDWDSPHIVGLGLRHSLPARRGALAKTSRVLKHPFLYPAPFMQASLRRVVGYKKAG